MRSGFVGTMLWWFVAVGCSSSELPSAAEPVHTAGGIAPVTTTAGASNVGATDEPKTSSPDRVSAKWLTSEQLAEQLDFTTLPAPPGKKAAFHQRGLITVTMPGTVREIGEFYLGEFKRRGFKAVERMPSRVEDTYAEATLGKDGTQVNLSVSPVGADEVMLMLVPLGNVDVAAVPSLPDANELYRFPRTRCYTTALTVRKAADSVLEMLAKDGWHRYDSVESTRPGDKDPILTYELFRGPYQLQASIQAAPAQNNATTVTCNLRSLGYEMPVPKGATDLTFDDSAISLSCRVDRGFREVTAELKKQLQSVGLKETATERPTENREMLRFENARGDAIMTAISRQNENESHCEVRSELVHREVIDAIRADVERRSREMAAEAEQRPPVEPAERKPVELLSLAKIPLPVKWSEVQIDQGNLTFVAKQEIPSLADKMRQQLAAAGWKEEQAVSTVSKNAATMQWKLGEASLVITMINPGFGPTQVQVWTTAVDCSTKPKD